MKNKILISLIFLAISCSQKPENYDLYISNVNYKLNTKTGEFKIDWYNNYESNIRFSKTEKEKINELLHKYHLD
ncbi:hypothetical protein, partial [Flavobacterium sp.]|uniref:hypothetical protein n=1 Tax=Flavobacterium sp. TaxID=239 RepID=UPI003C60E54F